MSLTQGHAAMAAYIAMRTGAVPMLWGPPGTGKTSVVRAMARALGGRAVVLSLSRRAPEDLSGPIVAGPDGWAAHLPPGGPLRELVLDVEEKRIPVGIVLLDDLTAASIPTINAALDLILDNVLGDRQLGSDILRVAAGNPPSTSAGCVDLPASAANRLVHLDWPLPDVEEWIEDEWSLPSLEQLPTMYVKSTLRGWRRAIGQYLSTQPDMRCAMPRGESEAGGAWPSPRSWSMLARCLTAAEDSGVFWEVRDALIVGCVGHAAAVELEAHLRGEGLPPADRVLADPRAFSSELSSPHRAWAIGLSAVSAFEGRAATKAHWRNLWVLLKLVRDSCGNGLAVALGRRVAALRAGPARGMAIPRQALSMEGAVL